jgi:trans-2-enoyl-CoA reductase
MGLLIRSIFRVQQQQRALQSVKWIVRRSYSGKSDITASAMVYSDYGQPSEVLK